ncbi:substrate-binding domain-containing protein [Aliiroseovarius sp. YM-037]|uniref:substrate-binding domain-containing protein n=1 Tax=Aliiroseovarius sp. YM-037 TaxID=3341728 RepID=UPI003A80D3B1
MRRLLLALAPVFFATSAVAETPFIIVQSTTSTQNSGLYDAILPQFQEAADIEVRVVAVGTGQALKNAQNCDGDVLLVHAKSAEEKFVEDGFGLSRSDVMYNDFIIVGPANDPAQIHQLGSASAALTAIASTEEPFASRGDDSGTHKKERALWEDAVIDPNIGSGTWYRETGSGMGATLNAAIGMNAYTITDRATWLAFGNKEQHGILLEGDDALFNQYGVIAVNPAACPNVKQEEGQIFIDWLLSEEGQTAIGEYRVEGQQLFFPNGDGTPL